MAIATADPPAALALATTDQPAARAALAAALTDPLHAYLFAGPAGSGKRAAARAFAAELLAAGAPDADDARRRALVDPSPHPDLVWLEPPGTQHLVEEVRGRVISAAAYRPFEGERRVFVIAAAEAMADESQNALLKTLEEPAAFAHILLVSSEPELLLETVRSRCQRVRFAALSTEAIAGRLAERLPDLDPVERSTLARLAAGDLERAEFLAGEEGRALRDGARASARAARAGELDRRPWLELIEAAAEAGKRAAADTRDRHAKLAPEASGPPDPGARQRERAASEAAKRASRRASTAALDLGLELVGAWLRDLLAVSAEADVLLWADREAELRADAESLDGRRALRAAELVMDTRRRLRVNVASELALEALFYRVEYLLRDA